MTKRWVAAFFLSASLGTACASGHMTDGTDEMHAAIADARAENARYLQACTAADSVAGVLDELGRHEEVMNRMMDRMEMAMDGMSHCSAGGMGQMYESMSQMDLGMSDHRSQLEVATDVGQAHAECGAHASAMGSELRTMDDELGRTSCMGR